MQETPQFQKTDADLEQPKSYSNILKMCSQIPNKECKDEQEEYEMLLQLSLRMNNAAERMKQQKIKRNLELEQQIKEQQELIQAQQENTKNKLQHDEEIIRNLNVEIQKLNVKHKTQIDKVKALQENYEIVSKQVTETQQKFQSLLEMNSQLEQILQQLNQQNSQLMSEIQALKETKQQNQNVLQELQQNKVNLEQDLRDYIVQRKNNALKIQELKGNLRVICRIRPLLENENPSGNLDVVSDKIIQVNHKKKQYQYTYDRIFQAQSSQQEIFNEISDLVQGSLDGQNLCIFAYGQTGSGKTHTMIGDISNPGIIINATTFLFKVIEEMKQLGWSFTIKAQFLEIYNDKILDLFEQEKTQLQAFSTNLIDPKTVSLESSSSLLLILNQALQKRQTAQTKLNFKSSRSHCIFTLVIQGQNSETQKQVESTINLIDLAGSENASAVNKENQEECKFINKSLSALGSVIQAIAEKKNHVPYRNSKLTELLKNSLGGNSTCLMFLNIQDKFECQEQTLNSLRFGQEAIKCKIGQAN